jgi:hypothetical protein
MDVSMHNRRVAEVIAFLATSLVVLAPAGVEGQGRAPAVNPPLSKTADGQPDIRGHWGTDAYTQDLETGRPDEETNTIQGRGPVDKSKATSVISDPADGKIPYQAWAAERRVRIPTFRRGDISKGAPKSLRDIRPQTFCLIGLPRLNWYGDFLIAQIPGYVVMQWEWSHAFRVIPLDDKRPHLAITPAAGFISPMSAILLGGFAAVPSYFTLQWRAKTSLDDSLDVLAAHGVGGTVGAMLTGVFAEKALNGVADGALFGNPGQLLIQGAAVLAAIVYSGVMSFVLLKLIALFVPLRATSSDEASGLDITMHGEEAYVHADGLGPVVVESPDRPMGLPELARSN